MCVFAKTLTTQNSFQTFKDFYNKDIQKQQQPSWSLMFYNGAEETPVQFELKWRTCCYSARSRLINLSFLVQLKIKKLLKQFILAAAQVEWLQNNLIRDYFMWMAGGWTGFPCTDGVMTSQRWDKWIIIPRCLTSKASDRRSSATWLCKSADSYMDSGRTSSQRGRSLSAAEGTKTKRSGE